MLDFCVLRFCTLCPNGKAAVVILGRSGFCARLFEQIQHRFFSLRLSSCSIDDTKSKNFYETCLIPRTWTGFGDDFTQSVLAV